MRIYQLKENLPIGHGIGRPAPLYSKWVSTVDCLSLNLFILWAANAVKCSSWFDIPNGLYEISISCNGWYWIARVKSFGMFSSTESGKIKFHLISRKIIYKRIYLMADLQKSYLPRINGDTVGLGSNKLGWLHTFLNCIKTLITDNRFPPARVSLVFARLMKSSYKNRWRFDNGHFTTWLVLEGYNNFGEKKTN